MGSVLHRLTNDNRFSFKKKVKKRLFPPGIEPGTFRVLGERDNRYTMETALVLLTPEYALPYTRGAPRKYETSPTPRFVALRGRWSRWWKQFFNTTFSYLERTLNSTSSNGLRLYDYALFPDDAYWPKILKQ